MSRDSGGTYTLPNAAFASGTVISSSTMNSNFSDLTSEMTNSLDRNGKGGMLARLRGVDGTAALPAYAFTDETTLGFYRSASNDLRASSNGTDIQKWSSTAIIVYPAFTAQKGITITNSTTNEVGATVTGNGTGAGGVFTGGATGRGLTVAAGASGNADGINSTGHGTGSGGSFAGGATGYGVYSTGTTGVVGIGTSAEGINGQGAAGAAGLKAIAGTAASASTPQTAIYSEAGYITFTGASAGAAVNPNSNVAFTNTATPLHIAKAWVVVNLNNTTSPTIVDALNVTSITITGGDLVVTLAGDFADTNYCVIPCTDSPTNKVHYTTKATGSTTFSASNAFGTPSTNVDMSSISDEVSIAWFGRQ